MVANLPSLRRFSLLNRKSDEQDVAEAVSLLIADLKTVIARDKRPGAARKSIADLLHFLHGLENTAHPGQARLTQAISDDILPRLLDEQKKTDRYKFLQAEKIFAEYAGNLFKQTLDFLRASVPEHPAYGQEILQDPLPRFCFLEAKFAEGLQQMIHLAIKGRMRNKNIETTFYKPLEKDYLGGGNDPVEFFNKNDINIRAQISELLEWCHETHNSTKSRMKAQIDDNKNPTYSPEKILCQEILDRIKLHSEQNSYFLPQCAGFRFFKNLINLDREKFKKSFSSITAAMQYGESHDYIVRQVDRLTKTLNSYDFDLVALSHYNLGTPKTRITFRALQDSCVGSARERSRMMENRPLLAAELGRRPVQLARELLKQANDPLKNIENVRPWLEEFVQAVSKINKVRFEKEIKACVGMFLDNKALRILARWIEKEDAEKNVDFVRVQQVETALLKIWEAA